MFGYRQKLKSKICSCVVSCKDVTPLDKVDIFKYLGIWLDSELSFKLHINHILHKIYFRISILHRSQNSFSYSVHKKLDSQLICPMLYVQCH